jgi:hypothetical protein
LMAWTAPFPSAKMAAVFLAKKESSHACCYRWS